MSRSAFAVLSAILFWCLYHADCVVIMGCAYKGNEAKLKSFELCQHGNVWPVRSAASDVMLLLDSPEFSARGMPSQVTFMYTALCTIKIVSEQLYRDNRKWCVSAAVQSIPCWLRSVVKIIKVVHFIYEAVLQKRMSSSCSVHRSSQINNMLEN